MLLERAAPRHVVAVLQEAHARVVTVREADALSALLAEKLERLMLDLPVDRVIALSEEELLLHHLVVAAEHADERTVLGDYRTVKDTVRGRNVVPSDNRIVVISPDRVRASRRAILPRNVRKIGTNNHHGSPFKMRHVGAVHTSHFECSIFRKALL